MRSFTYKELLASQFNLLPIAIYDAFPSVLFGRLLVVATKLGVFESLSEREQTSAELASSLSLPLKSIELMLPPLTATHYLKNNGVRYALAPQAAKWLTKSSPHYIGNFLAYIELLHSHWIYLEKTLKQGNPPKVYPEFFTMKEWETYTLGMMDLAKLIMPRLMPKLRLPTDVRTLLDVCGSHGLYSIELVKRHPNLTATIADFPQVLETTKGIISKHKLQHRISLVPCDVTRTTFKSEEYDIVLAFNIIHGFDKEGNKRFLQSIASALRLKGKVFILDELSDERSSGVNRVLPLMVGLNLLNEIGGSVYSFEEVRAWCEQAGLHHVQHHPLSLPGVSLVSASKS
ncbi:MAG: methyltransferase domain-containing protein [Ignavibacteria bacterium]|nr:methyltransferase domain-containing protein [Ignavibacteria bacterium]MBI3765162.1 methyltransferase domain-containing protein [Ignavibacteriales bacterium]